MNSVCLLFALCSKMTLNEENKYFFQISLHHKTKHLYAYHFQKNNNKAIKITLFTIQKSQTFSIHVPLHSFLHTTHRFIHNSVLMRLQDGRRQGDPICDRCCAVSSKDRVAIAIADGCNWGVKPATAARKAAAAFVESVFCNSVTPRSTAKCVPLLLHAIAEAQQAILDGVEDAWDGILFFRTLLFFRLPVTASSVCHLFVLTSFPSYATSL